MVPITYQDGDQSRSVVTQLDSGASCSAMSMDDLRNIIQCEDPVLLPCSGKIELYDGSFVKPIGRYKFNVYRETGVEHDVTFDIIKNAPWPIIDGQSSNGSPSTK